MIYLYWIRYVGLQYASGRKESASAVSESTIYSTRVGSELRLNRESNS
jgi:hypothetical protein